MLTSYFILIAHYTEQKYTEQLKQKNQFTNLCKSGLHFSNAYL